jgi:glutathione peroxidase
MIMRGILFFLVVIMVEGSSVQAETRNCPDTLNFTVRSLNDEQQVNLCEVYAGKVVLIVNTASKCAFTSQYQGLEALYATYKERGLVVLGFPSNDFANQEPGTEAEIKTFCRMTYGVQFPMFAKTRV